MPLSIHIHLGHVLRYLACMQAGLLGVLGLAFGMVMETTLLIIRSNRWVWP